MRGFVRPSVGPLVHHARVENAKTRIYYIAVVIVCVWVCEWVGWGWGEAGGWMPLLTRPQRYCDTASLAFSFKPLRLMNQIASFYELKTRVRFSFFFQVCFASLKKGRKKPLRIKLLR